MCAAFFDGFCSRNNIPAIRNTPPLDEVTASRIEDLGPPDKVIARRRRHFDLIVLAKPTSVSRMRSKINVNAALFETGRPVLLAPDEMPTTFGRKIANGWNDSAKASRAIAAAMRFIVRPEVEQVTILTAESDRTPASVAEELAACLACHGVTAEPWVFAWMEDRHLGGDAAQGGVAA